MNTFCPSFAERGAARERCAGDFFPMESNARSFGGSAASTFASAIEPSDRVTLITLASSTTWLAVSRSPSILTKKPVPIFSEAGGGGGEITTRRGNAVAQYNLGVMYAKGEGVRRDDTVLRL